MVDRKHKEIKAEVETLYIEGPIEDAIRYLQKLKKLYPRGYISKEYGSYREESDRWVLKSPRMETDKERDSRVLQEERWEKQQAERDAAEYERLKKQFGG